MMLIRPIQAPVNPSDINQIEGKYPIKPSLPAVAGNEGVGVVRSVGSQVCSVHRTINNGRCGDACKLHRLPI
jgi:NADPH:quinone reductase-like Zn-dependent oxidoreductase